MRLIRQPLNSNLCGQACVAMVLGRTLKSVKPLFQRWGLTQTRHLVKALQAGGYHIKAEHLTRVRHSTQFPALAICRFRWSGLWKTHWVVWAEGRLWDPEGDGTCGGRMTAYLSLERRGVGADD